MKRVVLLIAALCMFGSQAAAKSDKSTEAQQIAKLSDKVSRRGNELFFKLKDGTTVSRKNTYCEESNDVSYTFYDFLDPWYVIREGYYESYGTGFINRDTGETTVVSGASHFLFSPDKLRFLKIAYGGEDGYDECWRVSRTGIARELVFHSGPHNFRWVGPSTIDIADDRKMIARLNYDGTSWRCAGSSKVCNALEITKSPISPEAHTAEKANRLIEKRDPETGEVIATTRLPKKLSDDASSEETEETPLISAARRGDVAAVESLIEEGADIDATDEEGWTALERASSAGQLETVKLLLKKGARPEGKHGFSTPLIMAAHWGKVEVARALLDAGADINAKGADGRTALMEAAWTAQFEMVEFLLSQGADVNATDDYSHTALSGGFNTVRTDKTPEVIKLLVDNGADKNARDEQGVPALSRAAEQGETDRVRFFLEKGADVNAKDHEGETALMKAALKGRLETVRVLLDSGANPRGDGTALRMAASGGHHDVVKLLLDRGADVNARDQEGLTALIKAAWGSHPEVVRLLLDKGADVNTKDNYGWTALTWAVDLRYGEPDLDLVKLLKDRGAKMTLTAAACLGDLKEARRLINAGVDINAQGENGTTALMCAAQAGHLEVVKLLLDKGADMNIKNQGYYCWTALDLARQEHHKEIERLLKARGAKDPSESADPD